MVNQIRPNKQKTITKTIGIPKVATQIEGLDEILHGGLPEGKITLVSGGPGTGKTVFGLEFLYREALSGHPGIFLSFEETADNIRQNVSTFGWDLTPLEEAGKLFLFGGEINSDAVVSGDFNIKGLLAIIDGKTKQMGARRLVVDAMDVLLRIFNDPKREELQLHNLHRWLLKRGLTVVLTTKNLKTSEYTSAYEHLDFMADCVIYLDQMVLDQVNTKRIQVIKYRGSSYGSNEHPFLITDNGMFFYAISDMWLDYDVSSERVSSGNSDLDAILGGGYQKGSCILVAGETGIGKTSLASTFVRSACANGQKVIYVSFEESPKGMVKGMLSNGIDLRIAIQESLLSIMAMMPESRGAEEHLYDIISAIRSYQPDHVVVDAISACKRIAGEKSSFDFIMRLVHFCKQKGITTVLNNQTAPNIQYISEISGIGISSNIDTIIILYYQDVGNETNRVLRVIKSRHTRHSNKHHQFSLTGDGIRIDVTP
jgi:circadian clock protein KaiC